MKQVKTMAIIALICMIISTFLPWYSFSFSGSLNLGEYGSQLSSINSSINGLQATNAAIVYLLSIVGLILCFVKPVKYVSFILGMISIAVSASFLFHWIGLPMNFNSSIHTGDNNYGMSANSNVSNGIGLYLLLVSSIIYTISVFNSSSIMSLILSTDETTNTNKTAPQHAKVSKKTITTILIFLIVLGAGFGAYKIYDKNRIYKIDSIDQFCKEFNANNAAVVEKYKGHTIEITGTFHVNNLMGNKNTPPDFFGITNNAADIRVHVQAGIDKNFLTSNSIYPELGSDWFYNKTSKEIYDNTELFSDNDLYDNEKKKRYQYQVWLTNMKTAIERLQNLNSSNFDTTVYNANYLATVLNGCDENLKTAIQSNSISYCKIDASNNCIIDKITIQGKVTNIEKTENGLGQPVISLTIGGIKIINKERSFDFNKLTVLDYISSQKNLADKINLVRQMNIVKPQTDTTVMKLDTVKKS